MRVGLKNHAASKRKETAKKRIPNVNQGSYPGGRCHEAHNHTGHGRKSGGTGTTLKRVKAPLDKRKGGNETKDRLPPKRQHEGKNDREFQAGKRWSKGKGKGIGFITGEPPGKKSGENLQEVELSGTIKLENQPRGKTAQKARGAALIFCGEKE